MRFKAPSSGLFKGSVTLAAIAAVGAVVAMPLVPSISVFPAWFGYGGNPQHTNISPFPTSGLGTVKWSLPIDEDIASQSSGEDVLIHYASPCITGINPVSGAGNTVVVAVHTNVGGAHDGWRIEGLDGSHGGTVKWSYNTDYSAPILMPSDWTSVYPLSLVSNKTVVAGGGGGTVLLVPDADVTGAVNPTRLCFWGHVSDYLASPATYKNIKICTPITGDSKGNFYFGYAVMDPTGIPAKVIQAIGTGGVVKFNTSGLVSFRTAASLVSGMGRPGMNCAPAVSNDGKSVYFGIRSSSSNTSYLVKLSTSNPPVRGTGTSGLSLQASVRLKDPFTGSDARLINESSASPMVGPDGHVFIGVFGSNWRESHGWTLQFNGNLGQSNSLGRYPVGAFGWDDTASIVPASAVPSYTGASSYLLLTKYNNYYMGAGDGGNGRNHLAILDPNASGSTDWQSHLPVMTELKLITGVTCDSSFYPCTSTTDVTDPSVPVREWCINAAAVDVTNKCAVVNSEDGHAYVWDFVTNTLKQSTYLQPATGEAYTCTVVGPDGTSYAINNGILHAVTGVVAN